MLITFGMSNKTFLLHIHTDLRYIYTQNGWDQKYLFSTGKFRKTVMKSEVYHLCGTRFTFFCLFGSYKLFIYAVVFLFNLLNSLFDE